MIINDNLLERIKEINIDLEIRESKKSDLAKLAKFLNIYFIRKKIPAYFKWQYFSEEQPSKLFIALKDGAVVGTYGVQLKPTKVGLSAFITDNLIEEGYRSKGLYYLLDNLATEYARSNKVKFSSALPNRFGMLAKNNKLGWQMVSRIYQLEASLDKINFNNRDFKTQDGNPQLNYFLKDKVFKRWRFDKHPQNKYQCIYLDDNNYAFVKKFIDPKNGNICGDIVDIEVDWKDGDKIKNLLVIINDYFKTKGFSTITVWALPHTALFNILIGSGFKEVEQERYFCIKIFDPNFDYLRDIKNWQLTQADAEIY